MHFIRHAERLISCMKLQISKTKRYQLPEGRTAQLSLYQWPVLCIRQNRCFKAHSPAKHCILPLLQSCPHTVHSYPPVPARWCCGMAFLRQRRRVAFFIPLSDGFFLLQENSCSVFCILAVQNVSCQVSCQAHCGHHWGCCFSTAVREWVISFHLPVSMQDSWNLRWRQDGSIPSLKFSNFSFLFCSKDTEHLN